MMIYNKQIQDVDLMVQGPKGCTGAHQSLLSVELLQHMRKPKYVFRGSYIESVLLYALMQYYIIDTSITFPTSWLPTIFVIADLIDVVVISANDLITAAR